MDQEIDYVVANVLETKITDVEALNDSFRGFLKEANQNPKIAALLATKLFGSEMSLMEYLESKNAKQSAAFKLISSSNSRNSPDLTSTASSLANKRKFIKFFHCQNSADIKEACLKVVQKLLKNSVAGSAEDNLPLQEFYLSLRNEVTEFSNPASIKKNVWIILGSLVRTYSSLFQLYGKSLTSQVLVALETSFSSKKPEVLVMLGQLKGLGLFANLVTLEDEQKASIFRLLFAGMHVIPDVPNYKMVMCCLKLFGKIIPFIGEAILGKEKEIFDLFFEHLKSKNRGLKSMASETLIKLCKSLSDIMCKQKTSPYFREILPGLMLRLKVVVQNDEDPVFLMGALQAFGVMAPAARIFFGEVRVQQDLEFLIENSETTLFGKLDRFENFDYKRNPQNFKAILFNQRQLAGYFKALGFILNQTSSLSDAKVRYIQRIADLATRYLPNFFPPYIKELHECFSGFLSSLPIIDYNRLIFKNFIVSMLNSMDRHTLAFEWEHQRLFVDLFLDTLLLHLHPERQIIMMAEFLKYLQSLAQNQATKGISALDPLSVRKKKQTRDFFNANFIFMSLIESPDVLRLLGRAGTELLNIYNFTELRFKKHPLNFVYLRTLSTLMKLNCIKVEIKNSRVKLRSLKTVMAIVEENKEKYPEELVDCVHEFCFGCIRICQDEDTLRILRLNVITFLQQCPSGRLLSECLDALEMLFKAKSEPGFNYRICQTLLKIMSQKDKKTNATAEYMQLCSAADTKKALNDRIIYLAQRFPDIRSEDATKSAEVHVECGHFHLSLPVGQSLALKLPVAELVRNHIDSLLAKQNELSVEAIFQKIHFFASKICDIFTAAHDEQGTAILEFILRKCLELLCKSFKEPSLQSEQITAIAGMMLRAVISKENGKTQGITSFLDSTKHFYTKDLEESNFNNSAFLDSVSNLLNSCLSQAQTGKETLETMLDFLRLSHQKQNEYLQSFQVSLLEIIIRSQPKGNVLLNRSLEIFLEVFQHVKQDHHVSPKTMSRIYKDLGSIAVNLELAINSEQIFHLLNEDSYYHYIFLQIFNQKFSETFLDRFKILQALFKIVPLRHKISECFSLEDTNEKRTLIQFTMDPENANWKLNQKNFLVYFLSLIELEDVAIIREVFQLKEFKSDYLLDLFNVEKLPNQVHFNRAIRLLIKACPDTLEELAKKLLNHPVLTNFNASGGDVPIDVFKQTFSRLKSFFRQSQLKKTLDESVIEKIENFITKTLRSRDEMSIDVQKCKTLVSFLGFFAQKVPMSIIHADTDLCLTEKLAPVLLKCHEPSQRCSLVLESLIAQKHLKQADKLLEHFELGLSLSIDLTSFSDRSEREKIFFNEFLELVFKLAIRKIEFKNNSLEYFLNRLGHFMDFSIYNHATLFRLAKLYENVCQFLIDNFSTFKKTFAAKIGTNFHLLSSNSLEFETVTETSSSLLELIVHSGEVKLIQGLYFLFEIENQKFTAIFQEQCSQISLLSCSPENFLALLDSFINNESAPDKLNCVLENCLKTVLMQIPEQIWLQVLTKTTVKWLKSLNTLEFALTSDFIQHLFQIKTIFSILQIGFGRIGRISIFDYFSEFIQFFIEKGWEHFENIQRMSQICLTVQERENSEFEIIQQFLKELYSEIFGFLVVIVLKTRKSADSIVKQILVQEDELIFASLFQMSDYPDFKVLTNFKSKKLQLNWYNDTDDSNKGDLNQVSHSSSLVLPQTCDYAGLFKGVSSHGDVRAFGGAVSTFSGIKSSVSNFITNTFNQLSRTQFEMDILNQHPCMPRFLELFSVLLDEKGTEEVINLFLGVLEHPMKNLLAELFILKIILTFRESVTSKKWIPALMRYLCLADNGGVGFHYFFRDICSLIVEFAQGELTDEFLEKHNALCESLLDCLMRKLGDTSKIVFESNLEIFSQIFKLFRNKIPVNMTNLLKFINPDQRSHVWQIVGVSILKVLVDEKFPLFPPNWVYLVPKYEKYLLELCKVNSNNLVRILGSLLGKMELKQVLFSDFKCSNGENFSVRLLDQFPRLCLRLVVLLNKISSENPSFYLRQKPLRQTILSVFRACNRTYIIYTLCTFKYILSSVDQSDKAEVRFFISDILDLLPLAARIKCAYIGMLIVNRLSGILPIDNGAYFDVIYKQALAIWKDFPKESYLINELGSLFKSLLQVSIRLNLSDETICHLFVINIKLTDSFGDFCTKMTEVDFFGRFSDLPRLCEVINKLSSVEDSFLSLNAFILSKLAIFSPKLVAQVSGCSHCLNHAVTSKTETDLSYRSIPYESDKPNQIQKRFEENLTLEDIEQELKEEENLEALMLSSIGRAQFTLNKSNQRFSKESTDIMPKVFLKKFSRTQTKNEAQRRTKIQGSNICEMLWDYLRSGKKASAHIFEIFSFDMLSTLRRGDKIQFTQSLVHLYERVHLSQPVDQLESQSMVSLFYNSWRKKKLVISTNDYLLKKINGCVQTPLLVLFNEEYLSRLSRMKKNKECLIKPLMERNMDPDFVPGGESGMKRVKTSDFTEPIIDLTLNRSIIHNYISLLPDQESLFAPLSQALLPKKVKLHAIDSNKEFLEVFEVLSKIDTKQCSEAAATLISTQRRECFTRLQHWDEIILQIAENDSQNVKIDENQNIYVRNFSQLSVSKQDQLLRALLYEPKYSSQFVDVIQDICENNSERQNFERRFANTLSIFWLSQSDLNRARYFSEVNKETIREDCKIGLNFQQTLYRLQTATITDKIIEFMTKNPQLQDYEQAEELASLLKPCSIKGLSEEIIFDRYQELNRLCSAMSQYYKSFDTSFIRETKALNQLGLVRFFLKTNNLQKAQKILEEISIDETRDEFLYKFGKIITKVDLARLKLTGSLTKFNFSKRFDEIFGMIEDSTIRLKFQAISVDYFSQLESLKYPANSSFDQKEELQKLAASVPFSNDSDIGIVHKVISHLAKTQIDYEMSNEKTNQLGKILEFYLDSALALYKRYGRIKIHHKMPFFLKVVKHFPDHCPEIFGRFLNAIDPEVFLDWIPQLVSLGTTSPKLIFYLRQLIFSIAKLSPELLSCPLFFKQNVVWVQEAISEVQQFLEPYFFFLSEILSLRDPEIILGDYLRDFMQNYEENTPEAMINLSSELNELLFREQQKVSKSQVHADFLQGLSPQISSLIELCQTGNSQRVLDAIKLLYSHIQNMIRVRYVNPKVDTAYFSPALARFSIIFNTNKQLFYPFKKNNVRLVDLYTNIYAMNSVLRPKKLTFICSDNKARSVLVKYGEDLQEDARIMTIFSIFNALLEEGDKNLPKLMTYEVLPLQKNFAMIEWVPESRTLKGVLEKESYQSVLKSVAMTHRVKFINELKSDYKEKHFELLQLESNEIIKEMDREMNLFQANSLKYALISESSHTGMFFQKRHMLLTEYALCCLAGYLVSVGDRHLENIMIVEGTHFSLIDFGQTFGFSVHGTFPEVVPFRLTQIFLALGYPFEIEGTFRIIFEKAFELLRKNADCLNDYIEVYLNDPIEKWAHYNRIMNVTRTQEEFVRWKVDQFNRKLTGADPVSIILEELESSRHAQKPYYEKFFKITQKYQKLHHESPLSVRQVTNELMNLATNKDLLGRMWSGWAPFA